MSFIKENGTAALLLAAVFMSLGFILGKVTDCKKGHRGCHKGNKSHCDKSFKCSHGSDGAHSDCSVWVSDEDNHFEHGGEMIIVKTLMEDGFEGDTVMKIPGGEIIIKIMDGEVEVDFDVDVESVEGLHSHEGISHEVHKEVQIVTIVED
jgi:hypothetical protein